MTRIAIITTHPIQYNAPLFRYLHQSEGIDIRVFYTWSQTESGTTYDKDFGRKVSWDIPLLEGYPYEFVKNTSWRPGSHHFLGIINPGLIRTLVKWNPEVILVYGWNFWSHLRVMNYFKGKIKIWFRGDSNILNNQYHHPFRRLFKRLLLTWVYRNIDKALYVGKMNWAYFQAHGVRPEKLVHVPHAIDNDRFKKDDVEINKKAEQWRMANDIGVDDMVILYAGKIDSIKCPDLLLGAFETIRNPKMHLLMIGDGNLKPALMEKYRHVPRLHWLGFHNQSEMLFIYRIAEVVILPSRSETWGLCLNEAMASGRAIAASNACGGSYDLIEEGINGWIFEANSQRAIINCLKAIQEKSRVELLAMGRIALAKVEAFRFERISNTINVIL